MLQSEGSGPSSDVGGAGQSIVKDYAQVPRRWWRWYHDTFDSDWQVRVRAVFPQDEEEFTFSKVEFEVMRSCPSEDVKHFEMCRNVGDGGRWGK